MDLRMVYLKLCYADFDQNVRTLKKKKSNPQATCRRGWRSSDVEHQLRYYQEERQSEWERESGTEREKPTALRHVWNLHTHEKWQKINLHKYYDITYMHAHV